MKDYKNMTKEEVIELLQEAVADKKKELLEDVKACLNIDNREDDLGFSPLASIISSLSATTRKTEDCDEAIEYVEKGIKDIWLPDDDGDISLFCIVTVDVHEIRGLERLIGYLS